PLRDQLARVIRTPSNGTSAPVLSRSGHTWPELRSRVGLCGRILFRFFRLGGKEVFKPGDLLAEAECDIAGGAVAVLSQHDLRDALRVRSTGFVALVPTLPLFARDVLVLAVDEHHDVGVLLDAARFAQVAELGNVARTNLRGTGELRTSDDRDIEVSGKLL